MDIMLYNLLFLKNNRIYPVLLLWETLVNERRDWYVVVSFCTNSVIVAFASETIHKFFFKQSVTKKRQSRCQHTHSLCNIRFLLRDPFCKWPICKVYFSRKFVVDVLLVVRAVVEEIEQTIPENFYKKKKIILRFFHVNNSYTK